MTKVEEYLKKTGQTIAELCQGANQVGLDYILSELVPMALRILDLIPVDPCGICSRRNIRTCTAKDIDSMT